jgi:DNA-directed RNA polymerase subunit H (RpoH/RPB5)
MRLYKSGRLVDPMNLRSNDLDIRDIAHNLSMICRFAGSFPFHYSVGQHSLMVCDHMRASGHTNEECLAGLLHDAAEYLFNDLISSVKHHPALAEYRRLEHETSRMILATYGCNPDLLTIVKSYDTLVYEIEDEVRKGNRALILPTLPKVVYSDFLRTFHSLYNCPLLSMVRR